MKEQKRMTTCRVAIIGAQRMRVAKVVSLLSSNSDENQLAAGPLLSSSLSLPTPPSNIHVEYLPCVANFDSYENENGEMVRYLSSVEYHGQSGKKIKGTSLAPFFDATDDDNDEQNNNDDALRFPGISVVAIGCGIETLQDVSAIATFVQSLSNASGGSMGENIGDIDESSTVCDTIIECIQPNPEYSTMKEENEYYKSLDTEEKAEATQHQTIGPGKMAKFVTNLVQTVITRRASNSNIRDEEGNHESNELEVIGSSGEDPKAVNDSETVDVNSRDREKNKPAVEAQATTTVEKKEDEGEWVQTEPTFIDLTRDHFACRRCRTILFGSNNLQDPPHTPSRHQFSIRRSSKNPSQQRCGSFFLGDGMEWMGDISSCEGRISCPKCNTKVGSWKWSGAQCSCGTWVVPAIQIPTSKVDVITP